MSGFNINKNGCSLTGDFTLLEKLIKEFTDKGYVDVGVLGEQTTKDGASVAGYGAVHEFGNIEQNIPQRSFIKMPIELKQKEIEKEVSDKVFNFKDLKDFTVKKLLTVIGIACEGVIQGAFDSSGFGTWEPIKKETAKRKKRSTAILIDDGTLRKSITSKVGGL